MGNIITSKLFHSVLLLISLGTFAVGAGLVSGIFHVNENKDIITAASKVHGISGAIGFMALLFFPLLNLQTMGIYLTLVEQGFTKEQALMIAHKEIQHNAHNLAEENAKLTKMPFTYGLFKMFAKSHMRLICRRLKSGGIII